MLNMALDQANGQKITDIHLRVGRMSSIVPESVDVFFDYLSEDTLAEGAKLHFEIKPIEMSCKNCGRKADLSSWAEQLPHVIMMKAISCGCECGSKNLHVTGGVGFELVSLEVEPK
jgi:hydrogenase nickel insertion protein HypA